jgi:hypothetical protein
MGIFTIEHLPTPPYGHTCLDAHKREGTSRSMRRCLVGFLLWGNPRIKPPLLGEDLAPSQTPISHLRSPISHLPSQLNPNRIPRIPIDHLTFSIHPYPLDFGSQVPHFRFEVIVTTIEVM